MKFAVLVSLLLALAGLFLVWSRPVPVVEQVIEPVIVEPLSSAEFELVSQEFLGMIEQSNPRVALDELDARLKVDNRLMVSCHALVHEIGHAAYAKYADFDEALSYTNEICNNGYLHGVIETHFNTIPDVLDNLPTVCSGYDLGRCLHGVGHGLMFYTNNNLPQSLELCDVYPELESQSFCAQGVFMENFNTDQKLHPSLYLNEDDSFYPCSLQQDRHKADCFYYAPSYYLSLHNNDFTAAMAWCEGAERGFAPICVRGVGRMIIMYNLHDTKAAEDICDTALPSRRAACIDGVAGFFLNHYDSIEIGNMLCEILDTDNQAICTNSVRQRAHWFVD